MSRIAGRYGLALLAACGLALSVPTRATPLDAPFADALAEAYLTNPQLATERQRLREIDEGVPRALSGWRPQVAITAQAGASAQFDNIDVQHNPERRLPQAAVGSITQPLYTGGQVRAQVTQSEALVRAQRAALQASETAVLLAAATAYLDVARDEMIVSLNRHQDTVLGRSLHASELAAAAGAVTEADVAQGRARLADQRSATAKVEGGLGQSRAVFEQQVGHPPGVLAIPVLLPAVPDERDRILELASTTNFDVAEARLALQASQAGIDIARAGLMPKISIVIEGERFREIDVQQLHQRDNIAESLLELTLPLYQGGAVAADTRRAKEAALRSGLQVDTILRMTRQQAMTAIDLLAAAERQVAQQQVSIDANVVAERGIARQQSVGARTVIEVLNAQQELLSARVNLVSALRDRYVARLQLLAVTGGLSAAALDLPVPLYDPEAHYRRTRDRWYGTEPAK
ncbi:TolC family protein [Lichenicoccus sp.]|uniref:TolC family protein n=1 Tax=Lichenicoccus sp. TaxID=2781899 RepID=UPI003D10F10B